MHMWVSPFRSNNSVIRSLDPLIGVTYIGRTIIRRNINVTFLSFEQVYSVTEIYFPTSGITIEFHYMTLYITWNKITLNHD